MRLRKKAAAVILASGLSSRMKRMKPLLPLGSSSVIQCAVSCFIKAGIADITVVLGYKAAEIIPELELLNARIVINDGYREGMFSSVQRGVGALCPEAEAFFLLPGDYPLIKPETISEIYTAYERTRIGIIHPTYLNKRGHPPLISCRYRESILKSREEEGLRSFLRSCNHDTLDLEVDDGAILFDLDTPAEYRKALRDHAGSIVTDSDLCLTILEYFAVPEKIIAHSLAVASLAGKLGLMLKERGYMLDLNLIAAGALLHELAKGLDNYVRGGAKLVNALGMGEVAAIVEEQMDFSNSPPKKISEAALIYLADKMTDGDRVVPLRERLIQTPEKYSHGSSGLDKTGLRFVNVEAIMHELTQLTGQSILSDELAGKL